MQRVPCSTLVMWSQWFGPIIMRTHTQKKTYPGVLYVTPHKLHLVSPHRTRRTAPRRSGARSGPPPRPHGWCTSPAGTGGCGAPSCAAPHGSWWRQGRPCRSSPPVPRLACPVRRGRPCPSGQERWLRCCSDSSESSPASRFWCRRRRRLAWTTRTGPGSGHACTWASWRTSSEEGTSRPRSAEPQWGLGSSCQNPRWRKTPLCLEQTWPRSYITQKKEK